MRQKVIYDILHGNIEISGLESYFMKSPIVNRLHQVLQTSSAYTVFPNLKVSRFEHSLGTMNYSSKMYNYGIANSEVKEAFFDDKLNLIKDLISENKEDFFKNIKGDGRQEEVLKTKFCQLFEQSSFEEIDFSEVIDSNKFHLKLKEFLGSDFLTRANFIDNPTNILLFQTVRTFGLFHDIGHLPLSHLFEFSIESVFEKLMDLPDGEINESQKKYRDNLQETLKIIDDSEGSSDQIHELIGKNITSYVFHDIKKQLLEKYMVTDDGAVFIFILDLLHILWKEVVKGSKGRLNSVYSIVSGTIDADRMDYIIRDGHFSGIAKSTGNYNRIVEMFCLVENPNSNISRDEYLFVPSIQSLSDVEELLHQRFRIYKYMVNHHAVVRGNYLLQKVIENEILLNLANEETTNKGLRLERLLEAIDVAIDLGKKDSNKSHFNIVTKYTQLTDFWLFSILNTSYVNGCITQDIPDFSSTDYMLQEIYENKKNFRSLWKRNHEYNDFLIEFGKNFVSRFTEENLKDFCLKHTDLRESIESYLERKGKHESIPKEIEELRNTLEKVETIDKKGDLESLILELEEDVIKTNDKLLEIASQIILLMFSKNDDSRWIRSLEQKFEEKKQTVLIYPCKIKTGIKSFYLVDKTNQSKIDTFEKFSLRERSLRQELRHFMAFFIFYNVCDNVSKEEIKSTVIDLLFDEVKKM